MSLEAFAWSNRSGVLIARACQESDCDRVRVRVICAADEDETPTTAPKIVVVDGREALLAVVAGWLEQVAEAPPED